LKGAVGLLEEGTPGVEAVVNIVPLAVTLRKVPLKPNGGTDEGLKPEKVPKVPGIVGLVLDPGVKEGAGTKDEPLEDPVTDDGVTEGVLPEVGPTEGGKPVMGLKEGIVTGDGLPEPPVIDAGIPEGVFPEVGKPVIGLKEDTGSQAPVGPVADDGVLPDVGMPINELPEPVPVIRLKGGGVTELPEIVPVVGSKGGGIIELPEPVLPVVGLKGGGVTDDGVTLGVLPDP